MKKIITLLLIVSSTVCGAQWSNTTNDFYDTLHTTVSSAVQAQKNPIVLNSYPDGGYFVIWEDDRNMATTKTDIYAQKYNAAGQRLWAENGVPVANGPNTQRYTFSSNQDYRSRSHAATDSAGGFYITYVDDSVTNYYWERIVVQHMLANANRVFGNVGYIMAQTPANQSFTFTAPLLVPDGRKGFFLAYKVSSGNQYIDVYSYKEVNGAMINYGGGRVNENAIQVTSIAQCGIKLDVVYPGTTVPDYNIWYDGQGGCNIIMSMNGNTGAQYNMLCYNRIWRAKTDAKVKTFYRNESGVACPKITDYKKDALYMLYILQRDFQSVACGGGTGPLYVYTNYRLISNGYQLIDIGGYDYSYPKGTTVQTPGNINVDMIAVTRRNYANNILSDFTVQGYAYRVERFDSVPYQRAAHSNPDFGFNTSPPATLDNLDFFRDTLLASSNYYPDFSLAGGGIGVGGQHIYAASLMSTGGDRVVRLQHLAVEQKAPKSYAVVYKTNKQGAVIGREINTGFGSYNISYDFPQVSINRNGRALFYIREYYRSARVSPIVNGAELAWGAMGRSIGTGIYNNSYYNFEQPVVALHPTDGSGLIAWRDNRGLPGSTGENIFQRHLDSINEINYLPPAKAVRLMPNPYGGTVANPIVFFGTTKQYSNVESFGMDAGIQVTSTVAQILDNYNLGNVGVNVFQNSGALRRYNGQPYLNRNYTIIVENKPTGAAINVRLFFTNTEFDALKNADNSVKTPADLVVIQQPNNVLTAIPNVYSPVSGEQVIKPIAWKSVAGGFYVEIAVKSFSNFFIQKAAASALCKSGNISITSGLAGASYQWQANTGSGFANIANNSFYNGTNTVTLQLNNVPTSWYGYQYRCMVDGNASYAVSLQFLNTWTGAVNSAWENAANWSCGVVPDGNTDVMINGGTVVVNSNASCRSLQTNPSAAVTVGSGFKLTLTK